MDDVIKNYTYTGTFKLKSGNTILGTIHYVEEPIKHWKLYRVSDFINALSLPKTFSQQIEQRFRYPGMRHCWSGWFSIKSALNKIQRPSNYVLDMISRKSPEFFPERIKIEKKNKVIDFLLSLPDAKLIEALLSYNLCKDHSNEWVKRFGGNPDKFSFNDFEEFSALDYIDFISSFDLIVSKKIEAPLKEESKPVQTEIKSDGKNIQVTLNIKLM